MQGATEWRAQASIPALANQQLAAQEHENTEQLLAAPK